MGDLNHLYKLKDINFETRLKIEQVFEIAYEYISRHDSEGRIDKNTILYDKKDDIFLEGVWIITIDPSKDSGMLDNSYSLVISDCNEKAVYLISNHGRVIKI